MKINKNLSVTLVCVLLGVTLAWQYQSIRNNTKAQSLQGKTEQELVSQLLMERQNVENLKKKYDELYDEVSKYEATLGKIDQNANLLTQDIERLRKIAGLKAVKGKGVIITFGKDDAFNLRDSDLLDVVNELRASDAQAISINDERLIATSEIRSAGGYIVVNGKQMLPPYIIKAIGEPVNMENALNMMNGVIERLNVISLVTPKVEKSDSVIIPKVREEAIKTEMLTAVEKK